LVVARLMVTHERGHDLEQVVPGRAKERPNEEVCRGDLAGSVVVSDRFMSASA
jgi:hypothetical protein